ncbi:MAG: glycosyltransferase family 4 protein [Prevotella sp.]|nr:glycosyltransferase family 4 protein [Prevotella sp.]
MKRICFLVDSIFSIGGVQRVTAVIASALSEEYDVTIMTFDRPDKKDLSLYQLADYPIKYQFVSYPNINPIKDKLCKAYSYLYRKVLPQCGITSDLYAHSSFPKEKRDALSCILQEGKYDIVIGVHSFLAIRLATIKKKIGKTKVIGWIHNSFEALLKEGSPYLGPELRYHYGHQLQKLDEVVVLYQQDAEMYKQAFGFRPSTIYNPLTLKPRKLSDGHQKKFLAVGRLSPKHKGFDLLIQAFALFAQKNPDWRLDIVGDGPEKDNLENLITENQLDERVKLHPFTNDIQSYYSSVSIYVLSSRWEGMPLVLVEAMSHGLPIIASDLPICKEILGDSGLYFKNGDIQELSLRLEDATHLDWRQKSEESIKIAQQFDTEKIKGQWKQLLEI